MKTQGDRAEPAELIALLIRGDREAMPQVMERYGALVTAAARRVLRSTSDVEDVVQETWLALSINAGRIRQPDRLASWLWSTATNAATHQAIRSRRCEPWDPDGFGDDQADPNATDPLGSALENERRRALVAALDAISDEDERLILLLVETAGMSYRSVSELVGRPVGSLGPTRGRIIAKLRSQPSLYALLDEQLSVKRARPSVRCSRAVESADIAPVDFLERRDLVRGDPAVEMVVLAS